MTTADLQAHLHSLEERLFHPEREPDRQALSELIASDFREFCSSGKVFDRQQTLDAMLNGHPSHASISFFYVVPLSNDSALATYRVTTPVATSHRSSLWVLRNNRWQLLFHQGTVAA